MAHIEVNIMTNIITKTIVLAILASGATASLAQSPILNQQDIRLRDTPAVNNNQVDLHVKASKKQYKVGEAMSFNVKGNQNHYLYVFTINKNTGKSTLLIPNANTKNNYLHKNKTYRVPGTVEFFADEVGYEKIVFVATRKPIDITRANLQQMGQVSVASTSQLQNTFAAQSVRVRQPIGNSSYVADNIKVLSVKVVSDY